MKKMRLGTIGAVAAGAGLAAAVTFALNGCNKGSESTLSYLSALNAASPSMSDEELELLYYSDFFYDRLTYNEKKVYMELFRACREMESITEFDSVLEDTFLKAEYAFFADHPEVTWFWSYGGTLAGTVDTVYFDITDDDKKERTQASLEAAQKILDEMDEDLSDYDKMLYFYDKIIDDTDYVENENDQNMTSVFIENESVCAGYSRAFQYLCKEAGIECAYIEGMAYGFQDDDEEAHAWNLVRLGDDYYWVDVTWGDPLTDTEYNKTYAYFCSDDHEFFKTHKPEANVWLTDEAGNVLPDPLYEFELPECSDDSMDYYKQEGAFFEEYDREKIGDYLGAHFTDDPYGVVEFKMGDLQYYVRAINDLFDERAYIYDIIEDSLGASAAENNEVYFIQDDTTRVISVFME